MPSKQTSEDVKAIEELVNEIKQNLRLKQEAAPTSTTTTTASTEEKPFQSSSNEQFQDFQTQQQLIIRKQRSRPSPYATKPKSLTKNADMKTDDPYELLQSLLQSNKLIFTAVKRLQTHYSPKQSYFYDSDDERNPLFIY